MQAHARELPISAARYPWNEHHPHPVPRGDLPPGVYWLAALGVSIVLWVLLAGIIILVT